MHSFEDETNKWHCLRATLSKGQHTYAFSDTEWREWEKSQMWKMKSKQPSGVKFMCFLIPMKELEIECIHFPKTNERLSLWIYVYFLKWETVCINNLGC